MTIAEKYNWSEEYVPYTVEELRQLSAKHGMDVAVLIGYNLKENMYSVITVGKNKQLANNAVNLSETIMKHINPTRNTDNELLEDRREEHTD